MKQNILLAAAALMLLIAPAVSYAGKCTGSKNCTACKNCKYCKHCAKGGGTCGICSPSKKRIGKK